MMEDWIKRDFPDEQLLEVLQILSEYGTEKWHREAGRVKRDALIISQGSINVLRSTMAMLDDRDVLISEQIDTWVIGEINKYKAEHRLKPDRE